MSDYISRQAAIEALRAMQTYKLFAGDDMLLIDQAGAQAELMMLPPAQPEPMKIDLSRCSEENWERIKKEWANTPITAITAEPERIKGRWVPADTLCGIKCSNCGYPVDDFCYSIDYIDLEYSPNFCPNCGADMRGEQDG